MTLKSGSGWVKVIESYTSEFLMCHFLLVIIKLYPSSYLVPFIRYTFDRYTMIALGYFATPLVFNVPTEGFAGTISVKFCT